jgi:hypothetical protein
MIPSSVLPDSEIRMIRTSKTRKKESESFSEWQKRIAQNIANVCAASLDERNIATHIDNFGIETVETWLIENDAIDNNFLYNVPNIIAYLYKHLGGKARILIFSLAQYYQKFTGKSPYDLDWDSHDRYPRGLRKKVQDKNLSEHFCIYLLGSAYQKKFLDKDKEHFFRRGPAEMLAKSDVFRRRIEGIMPVLSHMPEIELLRRGVRTTLDQIHQNTLSVSEKEWCEFMLEGAQKVLRETGEDEEDGKSKLDHARKVIEAQEKMAFTPSDSKVSLWEHIWASEIKEERARLIALGDFKTLPQQEKSWIQSIFAKVMRYKMRYPEGNIKTYALPKNFVRDNEFNCFSGSWLLASLLMAAGFREKDIFIVDGQMAQKWTYYKHTFLVVRLTNGEFVRVDYWFNLTETAHSEKQEVLAKKIMPGLKSSLSHARYHLSQNEAVAPGLDNKWSVYRLTDGIILFYLVSLANSQIESWEYEEAIKNLELAVAIDPLHYTIFETYGILYEAQNDPEKAQEAYKKAFLCNRDSLIARFKIGEKYYQDFVSLQDGEEREAARRIARKHLEYYKRFGPQAWKYPPQYLDHTLAYLDTIDAISGADLSAEKQLIKVKERIRSANMRVEEIKTIFHETPKPVLVALIQDLCEKYHEKREWTTFWLLLIMHVDKEDEPKFWEHVEWKFILEMKFDK